MTDVSNLQVTFWSFSSLFWSYFEGQASNKEVLLVDNVFGKQWIFLGLLAILGACSIQSGSRKYRSAMHNSLGPNVAIASSCHLAIPDIGKQQK